MGNKKSHPRVAFFASKRITWLRMLQQQEQLRVQRLQRQVREQEQRQVRVQVQELLLSYRKQQGQRQQ
ncbi:MAG: hypothetical protein HXX19_14510 [Rhodoferax sp.]|nr:hypothetical protein [Rhodoferax sp.]